MLKITGIMACDPSGAIGKDGGLPWSYPEELEHFYKTIGEKPLIMGHRSYMCAPLELRSRPGNIVFAQQHRQDWPQGVEQVHSAEEFLARYQPECQASSMNYDELVNNTTHFMIGGAELAHLFITQGWLQAFILTHIKKTYPGDVYIDLQLFANWSSRVIDDNEHFMIVLYLPA